MNYPRLQAKERQDLKRSSSSGSKEPSGFGQAALPHASSASAGIFCVNGREVPWERGFGTRKNYASPVTATNHCVLGCPSCRAKLLCLEARKIMFSSLSGARSQQADSAVRRFENRLRVTQGERGDQILDFPKPVVLKLAFT